MLGYQAPRLPDDPAPAIVAPNAYAPAATSHPANGASPTSRAAPSSPRRAPRVAPISHDDPKPALRPAVKVSKREQPLAKRRLPVPAVASSPRKREARTLHVWLLVGAAIALGCGLVVLLALSTAKSVSGTIMTTPSGDQLRLQCPDCENGSKVTARGIHGEFLDGQATLVLPQPLSVGEHRIEVTLPGARLGGDQRVHLLVPLLYRIRAVPESLALDPPALHVQVEAMPGVSVRINGRAAPMKGGTATVALDADPGLLGAAQQEESFSQRVPFEVEFEDGTRDHGTLDVHYAAPPLLIEAPGSMVITDQQHFLLAGKTAPGARVMLAGKEIAVNVEGSFAQLLSVDAVGETTIHIGAVMPGSARRRVAVRVRRVADLAAAAEQFAASASEDYSRFARDPARHQGLAVALQGTLSRIQKRSHSTIGVLEVTSGCTAPPCLARFSYGGRTELVAGKKVRVFGEVQGATSMGDGPPLPEIQALIVLPNSRSHR